MQQSTVQTHLEMSLVVSRELSLRVLADLEYRAADPYAVRLTFHLSGDDPVTWVFARGLLLHGLGRPCGEGDVRVHPADGDPDELRIVLRSPEGAAVLRAAVAPVLAFLAGTERLVPTGRETAGRELDAQLAAILGGRENAG
ncbi:SsgA family sporulation/cell division regulator [Kitasatospora sp. NPDC004745]|uniref:SsgA family sporulation/cell division regulator n=1 Tax=Kitasatospora sp. NPDC004745 TaxID=3364019 RepID=UPI0036CEBBCE